MRRSNHRNQIQRFARGATKTIILLLILVPLAVSTLPSLSVAVTTTKRGTMNWAPMIRPMLPSSMIAVGLRTLRLLAALPVFMSLMMKIDLHVFSYFLEFMGLFSEITGGSLPLDGSGVGNTAMPFIPLGGFYVALQLFSLYKTCFKLRYDK